MISRILIANRGEVALRILRACRELNIDTVCVYSEADRNAVYLRYADETICIGPAPSAQSYLDIARIISAAEISDVQAIHPGYGFLSENAHFAEVCRSCRIEFIGPPPEAIALMGNKARAREVARKCGVAVIPGSESTIDGEARALEVAHEIGFPVMIKAAAGGGGRGLRVARNDPSFVNAFHQARAEAEKSFKDPSVYIEKYVEGARHVEIQVLADKYGNAIHLGERDCTIQRRHQKLIEESPSPFVTEDLRARMGDAALRLAAAASYSNAGTVEFLVDRDRNFYFMEMNTRLQVEHPVTEAVTGVDLVKEQILVASGKPLEMRQQDVKLTGSAMECRVNAEDPMDAFRPSPGKISAWFPPGGIGVRLDSHAYAGYQVSPHYDSLVGKLIVHRQTREDTIAAMRNALQEFVIEGIKTTIPLYLEVLSNVHFLRGNYDTSFIDEFFTH